MPASPRRTLIPACERSLQCMNESFTHESSKGMRRNRPTATYVRLAKITLCVFRPASHGVAGAPSLYRATQFTDTRGLSVTLPQWQ